MFELNEIDFVQKGVEIYIAILETNKLKIPDDKFGVIIEKVKINPGIAYHKICEQINHINEADFTIVSMKKIIMASNVFASYDQEHMINLNNVFAGNIPDETIKKFESLVVSMLCKITSVHWKCPVANCKCIENLTFIICA